MKLTIVGVVFAIVCVLIGCNTNNDNTVLQTGTVVSTPGCSSSQCEALIAIEGGDWEYGIVQGGSEINAVVSRSCVKESDFERCSGVWKNTGKVSGSDIKISASDETAATSSDTKIVSIDISQGNPNHATSRNQKHHDFMVQVANDSSFAAKYHVEQRIARDYLAADAAAGLYQN